MGNANFNLVCPRSCEPNRAIDRTSVYVGCLARGRLEACFRAGRCWVAQVRPVSRCCHVYQQSRWDSKRFCLWFYLCTGQVRPKIQRLRVRAAIVRRYVCNPVESPCGTSPPPSLSLSSPRALALSLSLARFLVPLPSRSLSLVLVLQEDAGKLIHLYELLRRIVLEWYSWLPVLSYADAGSCSRTDRFVLDDDATTASYERVIISDD